MITVECNKHNAREQTHYNLKKFFVKQIILHFISMVGGSQSVYNSLQNDYGFLYKLVLEKTGQIMVMVVLSFQK